MRRIPPTCSTCVRAVRSRGRPHAVCPAVRIDGPAKASRRRDRSRESRPRLGIGDHHGAPRSSPPTATRPAHSTMSCRATLSRSWCAQPNTVSSSSISAKAKPLSPRSKAIATWTASYRTRAVGLNAGGNLTDEIAPTRHSEIDVARRIGSTGRAATPPHARGLSRPRRRCRVDRRRTRCPPPSRSIAPPPSRTAARSVFASNTPTTP